MAAAIATEQCRALQAEGIDSFHFYTLNRAGLTVAICRMLGIAPEAGSPLSAPEGMEARP